MLLRVPLVVLRPPFHSLVFPASNVDRQTTVAPAERPAAITSRGQTRTQSVGRFFMVICATSDNDGRRMADQAGHIAENIKIV
jgi:hypothetical protein